MQECKYASILSPKFFDPNLTWPKLFQTERTRRLAHLQSFCELVLPYREILHNFVVAFFLVMFYLLVGWQKMFFPPVSRLKIFVDKAAECLHFVLTYWKMIKPGFKQFSFLSDLCQVNPSSSCFRKMFAFLMLTNPKRLGWFVTFGWVKKILLSRLFKRYQKVKQFSLASYSF